MHLEGTGKPGVNVEASVGDIYKDTKTGEKYKCTFAYLTSGNEKIQREWVKMVNGTHDEFPSRWIPKPEKTEPPVKSATVSTPELSTDQVIMKAKQEKQVRDYTSYGNKNKNGGKR